MRRRTRTAATAATLSLALIPLAACGSDGDGRTELTVATFSDFGYEALIEEYEEAHPDIRVKIQVSQFEQHHQQLTTQLAGGSGAADIVAVEEGWMPRFRESKDQFVNLAEHGANELQDRWLPWKWEQGVVDGGEFVMGYGTDVGSLAMCYRRDMFEEAGLPSEREEVSALWPTWDEYFEVGRQFLDSGAEAAWFDGADTIYSSMLNQNEIGYFERDETFVGDSNPVIEESFLQVGQAVEEGMSAGLVGFSQEWNVGFKQSSFATAPCPSWALGLIEDAAGPEAEGLWDIAAVPGGGGNWGGSFLTVPQQGDHIEEAAELAAWLTAPEQEKRIFQDVGSLPSIPELYEDPAVAEFTNPYFNDAPVGEIFAASAAELQPNFRGVRDSDVRPAFGNALQRVEQGNATPEQALAEAVEEATSALD
ncbi:extracellular solute-binding protein [Streptomyces sp. 3MP-14]|uniref:Extracellular solute-binding protein n=1 Tax=Streptomyces mimosae TaxID=2586635 RepID=A0A5N6AE78_9ACTN|nr:MULTISPECIES: extracellular solute-binding protein [Streptomyces]KAB8166961.1 extracellular solute-binding protein [Streptomyces mimosae]KAB8176902.1 extracellular solute-binding protein [Streptomyces sp. 3MP-14]